MKISDLLNDYLEINNDITNLNNKMKDLRTKKNKITDVIIKFMKKQNLNDLNYKENIFLCKNNKSYSTISQKLLKESLNKYFNDNKNEADRLLKFILNNRSVAETTDLIKK